MPLTDQQLAEVALAAARKSYSPYSKFKVGAAIEADREVFVGTNVENRSYGLTICAERSAVVNAVSAGKTQFNRLAIATPREETILPCGACLQVLSEFCQDLKILLVKGSGEFTRTRLSKLYPRPFSLRK